MYPHQHDIGNIIIMPHDVKIKTVGIKGPARDYIIRMVNDSENSVHLFGMNQISPFPPEAETESKGLD